jgi:3-deoxy-D-manno-octulosonic-acid transferase
MCYLLDTTYLLTVLFLSPWLLYRAVTTGKYPHGLRSKLTGHVLITHHSPLTTHQTVWFHGVSVGEIHLLRQVVAAFRRRHPDWDCVISTTTDTGFQEACKHFPDLRVFYWPFDFSWAVRRALREVKPSLVVLAEGELWPNFLLATKRQAIPVAVVNGRMSPHSARHYRLLGPLARRLFSQVGLFAVQTEDYAAAVRRLGSPADRVVVTGSVKYDGVTMDRRNARTEQLGRLLHVQPDEIVWIAGSTQAPEEQVALDIFRRARQKHPQLRLIIVPRQKDRFDEVADLLRRSGEPFVRRSEIGSQSTIRNPQSAIVLVDTIGELGALWGLANIAFVGGSLDGHRGGQNMIEPAAYGAAVVFGPHVWNFKETVSLLLKFEAAIQVADAAELESTVERLIGDAAKRQRLGSAAQRLVQEQQGATESTIDLLDHLLAAKPASILNSSSPEDGQSSSVAA